MLDLTQMDSPLRRWDALPFRGSRDRFRPSEHGLTDATGRSGPAGFGSRRGHREIHAGLLAPLPWPRPATAFAAAVAVRAGYRAGQWKNGRGYDQLIDGMDD
jgi:hypothetical protein